VSSQLIEQTKDSWGTVSIPGRRNFKQTPHPAVLMLRLLDRRSRVKDVARVAREIAKLDLPRPIFSLAVVPSVKIQN